MKLSFVFKGYFRLEESTLHYWHLIRKRRSIFITWLVSYISVLIIPLIISTILYTVYGSLINEQIKHSNEVSMNYLQKVIDSDVSALQKLVVDVAWDTKINDFLKVSQPLHAEDRIKISNIMPFLKQQLATSGLIDMLYVFYSNSDTVISSQSSGNSMELYDYNHRSVNFTYQQWLTLMQKRTPYNYSTMPYLNESGQTCDSVIFMHSLPVGSRSLSLGKVVALVNKQRFVDTMLYARYTDKAEIVILDSKNNLIASTGSAPSLGGIDYQMLTDGKGSFFKSISGKNYAVAYIKSQVLDWKYISIVPQNVFLSKINFQRNISIIGVLACILLGGIAAFILTGINYKKVKTLTRKISDRSELNVGLMSNELDYINRYIELSIEQKQEISKKLQSYNYVLKATYLAELLRGTAQESTSIDESLANCGVELISDYFAVVAIQSDDMEEKKSGDKPISRKIIANIFEQLSTDNMRVFAVEADIMTICIVNPETADSNTATNLSSLVVKAHDAARESFGINCTIAVSRIHENYFGISDAYNEALEMLEYRTVAGRDRVIFYSDVVPNTIINYDSEFTLEVQQKIINSMKSADIAYAGKLIEDIFNRIAENKSMSVNMAKCVMFAMTNTMINAMKDLNTVYGKEFLEKLNPVDRLLHCHTIIDMKNETLLILNDIGAYIQNARQIEKNTLIPRIKQYVEENYKDYNLNVTSISDTFSMNSAYISRCFKENTNESILDFINKIRLEKARLLLLKKSLGLNEIAAMTGYSNSNSFIRAFKRYVGVTPGKYREFPDNKY